MIVSSRDMLRSEVTEADGTTSVMSSVEACWLRDKGELAATEATGNNEEEQEKGDYIKEYKRKEHVEEEERVQHMKGMTRGPG